VQFVLFGRVMSLVVVRSWHIQLTQMTQPPLLLLLPPPSFLADWLDGKHVVFGRVIKESLLVVRKVENVATGPANRPKLPCTITECGEM
jgi:cyclophilin family peptidyl-prolyl cis-trans isomerase